MKAKKSNDPVAADGGECCRRREAAHIPAADCDRPIIFAESKKFLPVAHAYFFLDDDDPLKANTSLPFTA
jgi:hypothetical protein